MASRHAGSIPPTTNERGDEARGRGIARRTLLRSAGLGVLAATAVTDWTPALAASPADGDPAIPIASQAHPLTLPMYRDNPPIPSGLSPEKGPLRLYDWADYLGLGVVKSFEKKYGVKVELTYSSSINDAMAKIASGQIHPDAWVPIPDKMKMLVDAKLIQPINHSYIPNFANVYPDWANPWFDQGARYSAPDLVNLMGIGWRNDLLKIDPESLSNPFDIFWRVPSSTVIGLANGTPEYPILMAALRNGLKNFDRVSRDDIFNAARELKKLKHIKMQYNGYQPLTLGAEQLQYTYTGDSVLATKTMPPHLSIDALSYAYPRTGAPAVIDNWVLIKGAKHPVLAHLFFNHFLEMESGILNFEEEGFQPPLRGLTVEKLESSIKTLPKRAIALGAASPEYMKRAIPIPIFNVHQIGWITQAYREVVFS